MKILILTALISLNANMAFASDSGHLVIQKSLNIDGKVERVWSALTEEDELSRWWNQGVRLEPFVGGEFYEPWGDGQLATGVVQFVEPVSRIRFSWQEKYWEKGQSTVCEFSIVQDGSSTRLEVKHSGWEVFGDSSQQMKEGFGAGWDALLPRLKRYIEKK